MPNACLFLQAITVMVSAMFASLLERTDQLIHRPGDILLQHSIDGNRGLSDNGSCENGSVIGVPSSHGQLKGG